MIKVTVKELLEDIDFLITEAYTNREPSRLAILHLQLKDKISQLEQLLSNDANGQG